MFYLFQWFIELNGSRTMTMGGPSGISYQEIKAWSELTCKNIRSWETEIIKRLDRIWLNTHG